MMGGRLNFLVVAVLIVGLLFVGWSCIGILRDGVHRFRRGHGLGAQMQISTAVLGLFLSGLVVTFAAQLAGLFPLTAEVILMGSGISFAVTLAVGLVVCLNELRTHINLHCPKCDYDLSATGGLDAGCPECGWGRPDGE